MAIATSAAVDYVTQPNLNGSGSKNNGGSATRVGTSTKLNSVAISKDTTGVVGSVVIDGDYTDKAISGGTIPHNHTKPITFKVTNEIAGVASSAFSTSANDPTQLRGINKRENYRVAKVSTAYRNGQWDPYYGEFRAYGTYSRTGYTVTATVARHGLSTGDVVKLDFSSGTATDGNFSVTYVDVNTFTFTHTATGSTSGNLSLEGPAYGTSSPGTDNAATVSRTSPGDLVFRTGAKLPVRNQDYKPKTG
jgi:hypothetical protein